MLFENETLNQWFVFLSMAAVFTAGFWLVSPWRAPKRPQVRMNVTRRERELGVKFSLSSDYEKYRNPMRELRRSSGWPSGRQWVKVRKFMQKRYDVKSLAQLAWKMRYGKFQPNKERPSITDRLVAYFSNLGRSLA